MKNRSLFILLMFVLLSGCYAAPSPSSLVVDPGPGEGVPVSQHFAVTLNGAPSFVYQNFKRTSGEKYLPKVPMDSLSWTSFVSPKPIQVEVCFLQETDLNAVIVRPLILGIKPKIEGNRVQFMAPPGKKITIEKADDLKHVCFLFGHTEEPKPKSVAPDQIITFEPGVHHPKQNPLVLKNGQAVYLKPGAWVHGRIHGENLEDCQIVGRGTLCASHVARTGLKFGEGYPEKRASQPLNVSGKNLRIDGITVVDAIYWSTRIQGTDPEKLNQVHHCHVLGWYVNSDGFQDMAHTRASNLFTCVNDDAFILNNTGNCIVEDSVVWGQLAGAPLRLGWNGIIDTAPITYRHIDVLHFPGGAAIVSLKHGGPSHVKDILIEDIRIENPRRRFIELEIKKHLWSPKGKGLGQASRITLRNIEAQGKFEQPSHLLGAPDHFIRDVTFENVVIDGKKILDANDLPLRVNAFVENVVFKP